MNILIELDKFKHYTFKEKNHSYFYYDENSKKNIRIKNSSSSLISKYHEPFDKDYWAEKKAEERGVDKSVILKEWAEAGDKGSNKGNNIHKYLELLFNNKMDDSIEMDKKIKKQVHKFYISTFNKLIPVKNELVVGDIEYNIAGMVDQLFYSPKHDKYFIFDWKTNKLIRMQNDWEKHMYEPFDDLDDCNYIHYSLQLAIYKFIIEKITNIEIAKTYIAWFNEKNNNHQLIETEHIDKEKIEYILKKEM